MDTVLNLFKELNDKVMFMKNKYETRETNDLKELMEVVDYHEKYIYEINKILTNDIPEILYNFDRLKQRILEMKEFLENEEEEGAILKNKLKKFQDYHVEFKENLNIFLEEIMEISKNEKKKREKK